MGDARNQCATAFGAVYSFYIERPRLARAIGRVQWGIDLAPMYERMAVIGAARAGAVIADVPCGGGVALRALDPGQDVRYLAIDIDDRMLERTRARAAERGLRQVETLKADMRDLPLDDASVDLLCSFSGLHMIDDPQRAVAEFARVLRSGGVLAGSSFVEAGTRRQRLLFRAGERQGIAKPPPDGAAIEGWLRDAGLTDVEVSGRGFVVFYARSL
jgi:ubiquinone/menaquinone biosynthesis C-methylase UbiE